MSKNNARIRFTGLFISAIDGVAMKSINEAKLKVGSAMEGGFKRIGALFLKVTALPMVSVGLGAMLFFREQLGNRFWFGLVLAIAGSALILEVDWSYSVISGTGSLYGLMGGFFYAGFLLVGQKARYHIDTLPFFFIVFISFKFFVDT